jgi:hypothetical protein
MKDFIDRREKIPVKIQILKENGNTKRDASIPVYQSHTHNQNMVKTTNIWFAGYFSDVEISPNIYEVH